MVNDPVPLLPAASVAVHETTVVPRWNVSPLAAEHSIATFASTASRAVTAANVAGAPALLSASTFRSPGRLSIGAVVSTTLTLNPVVVLLPWESEAEHVTLVEPSGKTPAACEHVAVISPSIESEAVTGPNANGAPDASTASSVASFGTPEIPGAVVSATVTACAQMTAGFTLSDTR